MGCPSPFFAQCPGFPVTCGSLSFCNLSLESLRHCPQAGLHCVGRISVASTCPKLCQISSPRTILLSKSSNLIIPGRLQLRCFAVWGPNALKTRSQPWPSPTALLASRSSPRQELLPSALFHPRVHETAAAFRCCSPPMTLIMTHGLNSTRLRFKMNERVQRKSMKLSHRGPYHINTQSAKHARMLRDVGSVLGVPRQETYD